MILLDFLTHLILFTSVLMGTAAKNVPTKLSALFRGLEMNHRCAMECFVAFAQSFETLCTNCSIQKLDEAVNLGVYVALGL